MHNRDLFCPPRDATQSDARVSAHRNESRVVAPPSPPASVLSFLPFTLSRTILPQIAQIAIGFSLANIALSQADKLATRRAACSNVRLRASLIENVPQVFNVCSNFSLSLSLSSNQLIPKVHAQSPFHSAKDQRWKDTNKYFYDSERQFLITIFNNGLDSELNTVFHEIRRPGIREYGEGGREEKWRNYWTVSRNLVTRSVYLPPVYRPSWNSNHSIGRYPFNMAPK